MKKVRIARVLAVICLTLSVLAVPVSKLNVQAVEAFATVSGTVLSGTTTDLLLLSTKEGKMEIKLDGDTDTSACKLLLPNKKVNVSLSHGSDGYLHAVRISNTTQEGPISVESSKATVVTGTINEKSTESLLYFNTQGGLMEIKLDATTDLSGCRVLVAGKTYSINCARGSDAYMHALTITDSTSGSTSASAGIAASNQSPAPAGSVNASTSWVSGTVTKNTKENLLYLSTSGGEMQIVIDSNTDSRNGMVLTAGRTLSVSVYRGSDAYMHAASITGVKSGTVAASVDTSSTSTVTGTVGEKSTEDVLYLNTSGGVMELKLDAVRSAYGFKVLVNDKKVSVTCARGSDAYMHALDITAVQ